MAKEKPEDQDPGNTDQDPSGRQNGASTAEEDLEQDESVKTNKVWHLFHAQKAYFRLIKGVLYISPLIKGTKADERDRTVETKIKDTEKYSFIADELENLE